MKKAENLASTESLQQLYTVLNIWCSNKKEQLIRGWFPISLFGGNPNVPPCFISSLITFSASVFIALVPSEHMPSSSTRPIFDYVIFNCRTKSMRVLFS